MESAIATVLVAIIGLIGIIIQTKCQNKLKKQNELMKGIDDKIDILRQESKEDDEKLNAKINVLEMEVCKRYLIVEMTKIKQGVYTPNEETKRVIHETKELYNKRGRR